MYNREIEWDWLRDLWVGEKADRGGREEGVLSYQYAYSTVKMQVVKIKNVIANTVIYNKIDFKENWGYG